MNDESLASNAYFKNDNEKFLKLAKIVNDNPHSYFNLLKTDHLQDWIDSMLPQLASGEFTLATKVYWILNGISNFPRCNACKKEMKKNVTSIAKGFPSFCSQKCQHESMKKDLSMSKTAIESRMLNDYLQTMNVVDQLKHLVDNYPDNYSRMIHARSWLDAYVNEAVPLLSDKNYKMSTKLFWIFNCITSWNDDKVRCIECRKPFKHYNIGSINTGYPKFCCRRCIMKNAAVIQKTAQTCIERYGVKSPAQDYDIQKKTRGVYEYNGIYFRSSWEVAFYIFHEDAKHDVKYTPTAFEYQDADGTMRKYFPDFSVDGKLYEIKGEQFISKNGTFQNPFDHSKDASSELKRQCMIKNRVQLLRKKDMKKYLEYVNEKYGKDYLKKFRKSENPSLEE